MSARRWMPLLLCLLSALPLPAQTVFLADRWRFIPGDSSAYSDPVFPDTSWSFINVPAWWENEGYPAYDGYAWYRTSFTLDPQFAGKPLYLFLGKIDDADETWLNGTRIGATGKFPPAYETAWSIPRIYRIPRGILKANNVLAVRVYDNGGAGGIGSGPIGLFDRKDHDWMVNPPPGPKKSYHQPVTSNGLIAAVYNEKRGRIESARPHVFQQYDSAQAVKPFLGWLTPTLPARPLGARYRENTHVITATYPRSLEISYFAPFTVQEKIFYAVLRGPASLVRPGSFTWERRESRLLVDSVYLPRAKGKAGKYFLFGFTDSLHHDTAAFARAAERLRHSRTSLLDDEVRWMRGVIARAHFPRGIRTRERNVLEQAVSVLKMAQVPPDEIFPRAPGQILASLPPGSWNISWVRDGMYAILGLNRLRMFNEARRFLDFCLRAESGRYVHYVFRDGKDYGVGVPYQVSVTRYFGIGKEESDFNDQGPNIEFDDFGLFLTALCDYVRRSGDEAFFRAHYDTLARLVADPIVHNIDSNDVMRQDSGPWERHLPGKPFAYTSIVCAAGLRDFAALGTKLHLGDPVPYTRAFERLLGGIRRHYVVDRRLIKGNYPATDPAAYDYFDTGTFEAFAQRLLTDSALFASHFRVYSDSMRVRGAGRGFARINRGDAYETAEWVLLNLRIASACQAFGDRRHARELVDWVTDQAALNFNLLPELYAEGTAFYDGSIPMVGFGSGVYAVTLSDLYEGAGTRR